MTAVRFRTRHDGGEFVGSFAFSNSLNLESMTVVTEIVSEAGNPLPSSDVKTAARRTDRADAICRTVYAVAEMLPSQGPITAFAFLNPLQAMENQPFDDALRKVPRIYDCEPYLTENRYRKKLQHGRITVDELRQVLEDDLGETGNESVVGLLSRRDLRLSMLQYSLSSGHDRELQWIMAESGALRRFRPEVPQETRDRLLSETRHWIQRDLALLRPDRAASSDSDIAGIVQDVFTSFSASALEDWDDTVWETLCLQLAWRFIRNGLKSVTEPAQLMEEPIRHRDLLQRVRMTDCDQLVHELLVPFCSAYLDQGYATWRLPDRESGFFRCFCRLQGSGTVIRRSWAKALPRELQRIQNLGLTAAESVVESLELLGVPPDQEADFLLATLLALRGFSGMLWQTEVRPDRIYLYSPANTLVEFLAVRLILDRLALQHAARRSVGFHGPLHQFRDFIRRLICPRPLVSAEQLAFTVFQLAQLHGWRPQTLAELTAEQWKRLSAEVSTFCQHERRRLFHATFELRLTRQALDAVAIRAAAPPICPDHPQLQISFCIDAREESFRRHIEELAPDVETFGTAGFYGVAMYYRGVADAHYAALCPIVIKPQHWVVEEAVYSMEESHRTRAAARKVIGSASHRLHVGTRGSLVGSFVSTLLGPLATAPLLSRILFPRVTAQMHRTARQFVAPPIVTRLRLERAEGLPPGPEGDNVGFTLDEMAERAERGLRDIGLTSNFARLVIFLGHGSSCLNNPHESAYHCGACSGSPGGANARALAAMLNDTRVRRKLKTSGLEIPDETYFIGGLHNTATEEIQFFDMELLPTASLSSLRRARDLFRQTAERNAHERCRRFESAGLDLDPAEALIHVQERTEDLAQTRPEYGNGTNALCFVGRRSRIRGLYLDRRSFLMSYDATQDNEQAAILARILAAVIPVCGGINMLYTLSAIDSTGFGAGTKLPHNVTSLLGVMDGAASDLRPGLPWQGVDIHEPVRLLFIIETSRESMLRIMDENPVIGRICRNGWSQLATLDPHSAQLHQFLNGKFEPYTPGTTILPTAESSADWYRGWRDNLGFAFVGRSAETTPGPAQEQEPASC